MSTRSISSLSKPLSALFAALALGAASLPVLAADAGPLSREQVREELRMWKATNMMSQGGEISEPPAVLEARDAFYSVQTDVLEEESRLAWAQQWQAQLAQSDEPTPVVILLMEAE